MTGPRDDDEPGGSSRWSAIVTRLAEVWDSPAPHVRQNLATLAATLADDPEALEALAQMAAETAEQVVERRGQGGPQVLGAILVERNRMKAGQRERFDQRLGQLLAERWKVADGADGIGELLQTGFPLGLVPVDVAARAIVDLAGQIPPVESGQRGAVDRRLQERLQQLRRSEEGEDRAWRVALRQSVSSSLAGIGRRERRPVMLALLRFWPGLVESADLPAIGNRGDVHQAAALGRGAFWPRVWRPLVGAIFAATALMALAMAARAIQQFPLSTELFGEGFFMGLLLALIGWLSAVAVSLLYVPAIGRRLTPVVFAQDILVPALAGSVAAALLNKMMLWFGNPGEQPPYLGPDSLLTAIPLFVILAITLTNVHLLALAPDGRIKDHSQRWTILLAAAPAILLSVVALLAVHLLGLPGASLFGIAVVLVVAAASGSWLVAEPNRTAAQDGSGAGLIAYRASRRAAVTVAGLFVLALAMPFVTANSTAPIMVGGDDLQRASEDYKRLPVEVPIGVPFRLAVDSEIPFVVAHNPDLHVNRKATWVRFMPESFELESVETDPASRDQADPGQIDADRELLCLSCSTLPDIGSWLEAVIPWSGSHLARTETIELVPAVRRGGPIAIEDTPGAHTIRAGVPYRLTVSDGYPLAGGIDGGMGYEVVRIGTKGTENIPKAPVAAEYYAWGLMEEDPYAIPNTEADGVTPAGFKLDPGTYRICVFWTEEDGRACAGEQTAEWIHYPDLTVLRLADDPASGGP